MIIEFSVENFRSIKGLETLNMSAANIVSKHKEIDKRNVLIISDKLSLLKSKALYGANASGKSNIIKALIAFISIVHDSVKDEKVLAGRVEPFRLSTETEAKPTYFQLEFIVNKIQYRYGFEVTSEKVISEWLFGSPGKKEVPFFTREGNNINVNENQFKEGAKLIKLYKKSGNDIARENSLFLTTVKALNGIISKTIIDYIASIIVISGLGDKFMHMVAGDSLKEEKTKLKIVDLLKIADTGIDTIGRIELSKENFPNDGPKDLALEFEKGKKETIVLTGHKKFNAKQKSVKPVVFLMVKHESEGTRKMFELSPFIIQTLEEGRTLVIDEFDARFHPLLTRKLVELFNSEVSKGAQFVFSTHDTNLLNSNLLRRDQVSFVEKDKYGASHIYDLVSFKGVRNDSSFEKDYISGKYGAIPFIGDFDTIIGG